MDENKSVQEETEKEETKAEEKTISVQALSAPQSALAAALQNASSKSFGYETDKRLYRLLKEIRSKCEEYSELSSKIFKNHGTQKGGQILLQGDGLKSYIALNEDLGAQEVVLENAPIEIEMFPAGITAGDMILLEDNGIFTITEQKGKK